jgi:predicted Fe-S protein YdhL (DUF1289 family)
VASNDVTKAAAQLIADLVARTAASRGMAAPERATTISRRPPPTMPNLSPRGVQLMDAIIAARRPPPTPNTALGGGQVGPGGGGLGAGMLPDRSSMYAQNPNVQFQQAPPPADTGTMPEPTDPVQRYSLGLPPMDANGNIPPNWAALSPEDRETIWQNVAQAQGIDLSQAQQGPVIDPNVAAQAAADAEAVRQAGLRQGENLRSSNRGSMGSREGGSYVPPFVGAILPKWSGTYEEFLRLPPEQQAYYQSATQTRYRPDPGFRRGEVGFQPIDERGSREGAAPIPTEPTPQPAGNYDTRAPGYNQATWNRMTDAEREQAYLDAGLAPVDTTLPPAEYQDESGQPTAEWLSMPQAERDAIWEQIPQLEARGPGGLEGVAGAGLSAAYNFDVAGVNPVQTVLAVMDVPAEEVRQSTGSAAYYMATHDGERPPDEFFSLGSWLGSLTNVFGKGGEGAQEVYDMLGGDQDNADNALISLSMLNYLDYHPEARADVKRIYEDAIAHGASEDQAGQAVWDWFYAQQGFVTGLIAGVIWDPTVYIPVAGAVGRAKIRSGEARLLNPDEVIRRGATGEIATGRALSAPQDVADFVGGLPGRAIGGLRRQRGVGFLAGESEGTARRTAEEGVERANVLAGEEGATRLRDIEGRTVREQVAEETAAARRVRMEQETASQEEVARVQAIRDERAAEAEIRRAIREGDTRRANELRQREAVAKKNRDAEVREAAKRDARREEVRALEDDRQAKIAKAEVARKQQIRVASTPRGRESALARHEAKLENIRIDYEKKVGAWERKHGAVYADEVANLGDELTPAAPEPVRETTVFEEDRPGSNIDSVDQRRAEDDDAILRAQDRRAARESETVVTPPERIAVDVQQNGQRVTKDYLDPDYVSAAADEPNMARLVRDVYGPENPAAAKSFFDEYVPAAKQFMTDDAVLADRIADQIRTSGGVVSRDKLETAERTIRRVEFNAQSDALFELNFGERSPRSVFRQFDVKTGPNAGRMHPNDPRSWIEHAVYGDNASDSAAAIAKIRARKNPIMPGRTNDQVADWAERRANELFADVPPTPRTAPLAETPATAGELDPAVTRFVDDYRDDILSSDPDVSRAAAREAHTSVATNFPKGELRRQANKAIDDLRNQSGHVRGAKKPPGAVGIINDPKANAQQIYQDHTNRIQKMLDSYEDDIVRPSPEVPPPAGNSSWLDAAQKDGTISKTERADLEVPHEITFKRNGETVTESRTFASRLDETLTEYRSTSVRRERKKYDSTIRSGALTEQETDAIVASLAKTFDADYAKALARTKKEFLAALKEKTPSSQWKRNGAKIERGYDHFANYHRQNLQFNAVRGVPAAMQDWLSNGMVALQHGEFGAARNVAQIQRAYMRIFKDGIPDGVNIEDLVPQLDLLKATNRKLPAEYYSGQFVRAQLEGGQHLWTENLRKLNPLKVLAVPSIKRLRVAGDGAWRTSVFMNSYRKELLSANVRFIKLVEQKAARLGDDTLAQDFRVMFKEKGAGAFDAADVRSITKAHGMTDEALERAWTNEVDGAWTHAKERVRKLYFDYKKNRVDEPLSKVFMFHYFMTRSAPQHAQYLLQHPGLANLYAEFWESKAELGEKYAPPWLKNYVKFMGDTGIYGMIDAYSFFMPFVAFAEYGAEGGFNDTLLETVMNKTGLFFAPQLRAAAAIVGAAKPGDITATNRIRKAYLGAADYIRNSDADWVPEFLKDPGFTNDKFQDVVDRVFEATSKVFGGKIPFTEEMEFKSYMDKKQDEAAVILRLNMEAEFGPRKGDKDQLLWTPEQEQEYQDALTDLYDGIYKNPWVVEAVQTVSEKDAAKTLVTAVSPVPSDVRYRPSDKQYQESSEAFDRASSIPGDENLIDQAVAPTLTSDEARGLESGMDRYNSVGTTNEQNLADGKNQIIYGVDKLPDNYEMTVGGTTYTVAEVQAMDEDQRRELAEQWAIEEANRVGMVTGATVNRFTETAEANPTAAYDAERAKIRETTPDVADFTDYRSFVLKDPRALRESMLAVGDDTEFARALDRKRQSLAEDGYSGERLEAELDTWMGSSEAYIAVMGHKYKSEESPGDPLFSINNPPPWQEEDKEATTAASTGESDSVTGEQIDEGLNFATMTARQAKALLKEDAISPDGIEELVDRGVIDEPTLRDWLRDGTLLWEDLYQMAAQANLSATDLKYLREDGYLSNQDIIRLVVDASEESIAEIRRINRQRKRDKENETGPYTPKKKSGRSGASDFISEYISPLDSLLVPAK